MATKLFTVQESEDNRFWHTVKHLRTLRECYLEIVSYEEIFPTEKSSNTFQWSIKDKHKNYYYRILDFGGGIMVKKSERFDPRTSQN